MENAFFDELKESLNAAAEHARGKRNDLRITILPRPPKTLSKSEIMAFRRKMKCSNRFLRVISMCR